MHEILDKTSYFVKYIITFVTVSELMTQDTRNTSMHQTNLWIFIGLRLLSLLLRRQKDVIAGDILAKPVYFDLPI
jgi:hypothetical protein